MDFRKDRWLGPVHAAAALLVLISAAAAQPAVERAWNEEYDELGGQIGRLKTSGKEWRDRLKAEALDPQALIQPEDADPLDVVLERDQRPKARRGVLAAH